MQTCQPAKAAYLGGELVEHKSVDLLRCCKVLGVPGQLAEAVKLKSKGTPLCSKVPNKGVTPSMSPLELMGMP